jgi:glycosyltransferase involved in cell wall biosynthesis
MAEQADQPATIPVTVIVPTLNEAPRISTCLASVRWAAEIIVADGGSEDDTIARARQAGARTIEIQNGWIADQRNAAIQAARHRWILALDADETASPELADDVARVLANPEADAYRIRRRNFQRGEELTRGSWGRDWVTRLYRSDRRYLRHRVHERLEPGPEPGRLDATIFHTPYRDLAHHIEKIHRYAAWAAADLAEEGAQASFPALLTRPLARFWRSYLLDGGWRRGGEGVVAAALGAYGVFLKYAFLREYRTTAGPSGSHGR